MFQTFCKDEIFINYMQNKVKFLRVKKLENFAGFSFADDQYLFIQKKVPHKFLPQTISSLLGNSGLMIIFQIFEFIFSPRNNEV